MTTKGDQTRRTILQAAKLLFIQKGYTAVSMSDLCAATGLSRGGLYRYFTSTEEIFSALLTADKDGWEEELTKAMMAEISAPQMLSFFLDHIKKEIADDAGRLSLAIHEYARSRQDRDDFLVSRYQYAVDMMERLLRYGQERGEFKPFDPHLEAQHITIYLEGLKTASASIPFSQEVLTAQLEYQLNKIRKT